MAGQQRRQLTRAQVLMWRGEKWSYTDKQALNQALDQLPDQGVEYYEEPGGGRVIVTVEGKKAFIIRPGFVSWPRGTWVKDVDGSLYPGGLKPGGEKDGTIWAELSTLQSADRSGKNEVRDFGHCPIHGIKLPATGICDDCA